MDEFNNIVFFFHEVFKRNENLWVLGCLMIFLGVFGVENTWGTSATPQQRPPQVGRGYGVA